VGHQNYFLAPLPGSEVLLKSGIGKGNFRCEYCFYFYLLFYIAMENSAFGSLFGNTNTTTITVVDEPPPAQLDPFKIPMKIVEHVINNRYSVDELSIWVIIYSLYMNYASCLSVQVFHQARLRESYSLYH
jgi:hypothetical protein